MALTVLISVLITLAVTMLNSVSLFFILNELSLMSRDMEEMICRPVTPKKRKCKNA